MPRSNRVIRDLVHGYVPLDDRDLAVVQTAIFQRLRGVRQNDVANLVYPSMNTSRFEHSLGVFHLARMIAEVALDTAPQSYVRQLAGFLGTKGPQAKRAFFRAAGWYGLLHDIGHLPFSHLTEHVVRGFKQNLYPDESQGKLHEAAGAHLVKSDPELLEALASDAMAAKLVTMLMTRRLADLDPVLGPLKDIVDSDLDCDRMDSTARDGLTAGGDFGVFDRARLVHSAVIVQDEEEGRWRLTYSTRALSAIEGLLSERVKTHRWIHFQPKVVAFKIALAHCIEQMALPANAWHADAYVEYPTIRDDHWLLQALRDASFEDDGTADWARRAVLSRTASAVPLWKRSEDYWHINEDVAAGSATLTDLNSRDLPVLNRAEKAVYSRLTSRLNAEPPIDAFFGLWPTSLRPFEPLEVGGRRGEPEISREKVQEHTSGRLVMLTSQSSLVRTLTEVTTKEPAFGVAVIGDSQRIKEERAEIGAHFVLHAREWITQDALKGST